MTAHTPGPWHSVGLTIRDRDARTIARMEYRYPEVANDARLIAAAPELLAMVMDLTAHLDAHPGRTRDDEALLDEARAAIAKARGGA